MDATILPLAITMMAGPQILSAIVFVTAKNPIRVSLAYLAGILLALVVGVSASYLLFSTLLPDQSASNTSADGLKPVQIVLVILLIYLALHTYLNRKTSEQPKWLTNLQSMPPVRATLLGCTLILFFPSDFVILLTVGATLVREGENIASAIPFMALTFLIAALPLITYLLFRKRMQRAMPRVRDWTESNSWVISIAVYILFIFLIL